MVETIHLFFHTFLSQEWCCKKHSQKFNKVTRKNVEKPVSHACLQYEPIFNDNFISSCQSLFTGKYSGLFIEHFDSLFFCSFLCVTHTGQRVYRWLTLHSLLKQRRWRFRHVCYSLGKKVYFDTELFTYRGSGMFGVCLKPMCWEQWM